MVNRFLKLQRGTWLLIAVLIVVVGLANILFVRKQVLESEQFLPKVVLDVHGWPFPAVSFIHTHKLPKRDPNAPYDFFAAVNTEATRTFRPEGIKTNDDGSVTFDDGSILRIDLQELITDLAIYALCLALIVLMCKQWLSKKTEFGPPV